MDEVWLTSPIPSLQCSSLGRVRKSTTHRILRGHHNANGRIVIHRSDRERPKNVLVSRLVCETFHGPPPPAAVCMHLNDIPNDNRPENLQWGTQQDNMCGAAAKGRLRNKTSRKLSALEEGTLGQAARFIYSHSFTHGLGVPTIVREISRLIRSMEAAPHPSPVFSFLSRPMPSVRRQTLEGRFPIPGQLVPHARRVRHPRSRPRVQAPAVPPHRRDIPPTTPASQKDTGAQKELPSPRRSRRQPVLAEKVLT